MAAADYDRDGKLDVYCCCYSFFQSEAQYRYPSPYHDAQNGPPNFLFRNRLNADGTGYFEDVTAAVGLNQNNNRFSFAPAWCDYDGSGWPSLYVANDFGRNNLYRNRNGRFEDVAAAAGVEDIGPGMSAAWFDENGDGNPELYVANMWTMAGQQAVKGFDGKDGEAYRRHTKGNSLYVNRGDGTFQEAGAARGVEMGRWAWGADGHDFDNDGHAEIFITCGMITGHRAPDLSTFFWNHVVAASPAGAGRSVAYENAWNALSQFIREGYSWNGHESNVFYCRSGERYRDASAESGLDAALDSRAFAVTDIDGDGCLDVILKSRLGPQLCVFQNRRGARGERIGLVLRGTASNRDAIGARVRVDGQTKWITAGSGYLAQHTKTLYFGLGPEKAVRSVEVTWPSGRKQTFSGLVAGALYRIVEGEAAAVRARTLEDARAIPPAKVTGDNSQRLADTWFLDGIPLPVRKPAGLVTLTANDVGDPDLLAAYSLFRRYLFEYRAELELPLSLLLDRQGRAIKVYARTPSPAQVAADLKAEPKPYPYEGFSIGAPQRDFFKLGAALLSCGYPARALPYLEEVLKRQPENVRTLVLAGQIHREANRLDAAREHLEKALALDAQSAEGWNELGGVMLARGDDRKGLECFKRALAVKPDLSYALLNAAQSSSRLQQHEAAAGYYERVIALDAKSAGAHNGLGLALAQAGRSGEAERALRRAVELEPALGPAWNNLAVLLLQAKRESEAEDALRQGIVRAPKEELLYLNLARVHVSRGNRPAARRVMEDLLRVNPNSDVAKRAIASLR
jgi:Flp pilus assembly protein TadD